MISGHDGLVIEEFNGRFNRGRQDACPLDHAIDEQNNCYSHLGFETRYGFDLAITISSARRIHKYARTGEADRLLILDNSGNIYDSTNLVTPILTIVGMTDFSLQVMFNRAYITPHNGEKGSAGQFLYVYQGSGVARKAGGSAPSSFTLTVGTSASSGKWDAGKYLFAVAFEYDTGFVTKPGPVGAFTLYNAPGGKKIDISGIPVGPAGVVARHILASQVIIETGGVTYSGRQDDYEMFFLPDGRIGNNTATSHTVDNFSADLVSSADYLIDQLEEIPASLGLCEYLGSLITWSENDKDYIVRVSKANEPESFSATDGFVKVNPGDSGGGVKLCLEYKGNLNIHKSNRSYTVRENGSEPINWKPIDLDKGIGTEVFGASEVLDSRGNTMDRYLIASRRGLMQFIGNFAEKELSWKIDAIWKRINKKAFNKIQVNLDPIKQRIYVAVPLDAATLPSHILMCDYQNGMDAASVRWSVWVMPNAPTTIVTDVNFTTEETRFRYGSLSGNVYEQSTSSYLDFGTAIDSYYETALITGDEDGGVSHFNLIKVRVIGSGQLQIRLRDADSTLTDTLPSLTLFSAPGREMAQKCNFKADRAAVRFRCSSAGYYYQINRIRVFANSLWKARPN